ncbi:hypothetical protein MIMGU_mgv1a025378mg [Erythranthe guttata]|uniref:Protein TIC 214 n=1 Tax=Erythranthe guttata TaxID=4155 RepID=A0A022QKP8_ERYGU|nr:hypothetical protein MIMGU_mgv1a025378mg [Erythranthe guttata]
MAWIILVLVWMRQNHCMRSNKYIRSNKYLVSKLINFMSRIFSILLCIAYVYYKKRVVIFTTNKQDIDHNTTNTNTPNQDEVALIQDSQQSDFRRGIIKGSMRKEKTQREIPEAWDTLPFAQVIRGCMSLNQSIFRKYIILPSFIIAKNVGRIFLFQFPEWSEDLQEWNREIHLDIL